MRTPALPSPRRIAAGAGLALLGGRTHPIAAAPPTPAGTGLVISEVYGGGGNAGATYTHDFIELYNPTDGADRSQRLVRPVPLRHRHRAPRIVALSGGAGRQALPGSEADGANGAGASGT